MPSVHRSPVAFGLFWFLVSGCQAALDPTATSPVAGVPVPEGWSPSNSGPSVPGTRLATWTGPEGATLVLFRSLGIPNPDPAALGRELAHRLTNLPGTRVLRTETFEGTAGTVALVEVVAPGDGGRLAPSGLGVPKLDTTPLVPTRQLSAGHPSPARTLWLVAHYPDAAHERLGPVVEQILRGWNPGPAHRPNSIGY